MTPIARVMADPSLMLSGSGLDWLERDATARATLVVPRTFVDWLTDPVAGSQLPSMLSPDDVGQLADNRSRLESMMRGVPTFSHEEVTLTPAHEEIRAILLLEGGPLADLHADEWAFLQSQSTLLSKLRRPVDAFRDAGAIIVEVGRKTGIRLVERVIPKESLPETFTRGVLAKAAAKWIVLGGATVGGGTLGGVVGTAFAGPAVGGLIGAKAGGFAAGAATNAALLAIDP
jgi:hypothetical protein